MGTQTGFSKGSFIAMDAVKWIVENVKGVGTRKQAVKILRVSQNSILIRASIHAVYM